MGLEELGLTLKKAKNLYQGEILHTHHFKNADGTCQRWKVTSIKTWKRDPNRIQINLKRGLREYITIYYRDIKKFHRESDCPWTKPTEELPTLIGLDKGLDKTIAKRMVEHGNS